MKNLLKALFLFVALFAFTQGVWAETFITDVMVIAGDQSQTDGYKTQLQNQGWTVIDMTGRIIISRDGVHTVSTNGMTPGVYVLRLINDEIMKTQKIVIQ
jgi:hypothetical protein